MFVGSIAGTTESPLWAGEAIHWKFDVSRPSELTVYLYLKNPNPSQRGQDISLGVVRIDPLFEEKKPRTVDWLDVQEGTGRIRIGVGYVKEKYLEIGVIEEVLFHGSAWRKQDTQQVYALKTIRIADISPLSALLDNLRFQINSPFIAPLTFASQSPEGLLYLLSPFITGGHLFYYLSRDQCFEINRATFYAAEILCALDHLHDFDIVYRGLGPSNVLLNSSGHVTIVSLDLFFSETNDEVETLNRTSRCPSPEMLLGQGHSKAADWWTFGVLLYEMLTGLPPFYDENADEMDRKTLSEPLQLPISLSPSARDILLKLLSRNPEERLGAKGAFEIRAHPFFDNIDWNKLVRREYEPPFKPYHVATSFQDQIPGPSLMEQFKDWSYNIPVKTTEGKTEIATPVQKWTLPKDSKGPVAAPSKKKFAKAPKELGAADPHPPSSPPQAAVDQDPGEWELVWEDATQVFLFHNRSTNAKQLINARAAYPKSQHKVQEAPATRATLEDNHAAHHVPGHTSQNLPTQAQKEDVLEAALKAGYSQIVRQLLDRYGMDLNIHVLRSWQTPLIWATEYEKPDLVKLFLDHGADTDYTPGDGVGRGAALLKAVEKRNQVLIEILAQKTKRVLCTIALGSAVDRQDAEMVTVLLANGVRCDFEESDRPRPHHPDGGCILEDISYPDQFMPPLVRAVILGDIELVRLLLTRGANANVGYHDFFELLQSWEKPPEPRMECGRVIQLAMGFGRQDMVQLLLDFGADISLPQPVWRHHECMMTPRATYFKITAGLRAAVAARAP